MQTNNTRAVLIAIAEAQADLAKAQKAVIAEKPEKAKEALQRVSLEISRVYQAV